MSDETIESPGLGAALHVDELEAASKGSGERPSIDHLPYAYLDGVFIPVAGDAVVVERVVSIDCGSSRGKWLDTRAYEVKKVTPETGAVLLYDHDAHTFAVTNYLEAESRGHSIRQANSLKKKGYSMKYLPVPPRVRPYRAPSPQSDSEAGLQLGVPTSVQSSSPGGSPRVKSSASAGPMTRKVYIRKGILHICGKGKIFEAPDDTTCVTGERVGVDTLSDGAVAVTSGTGAIETWRVLGRLK